MILNRRSTISTEHYLFGTKPCPIKYSESHDENGNINAKNTDPNLNHGTKKIDIELVVFIFIK